MHEAKSHCVKKLPMVLFAFALASGWPPAVQPVLGASVERACADTVSMDPDDRYRGRAARAGETTCYRLDLHSPGVLAVSAAASTSAPTEPRLRLRHQPEAEKAAVVVRNPSLVVLRIREPGSFLLEVGPQSSRGELGEHVVTSRFVAETDAVVVEISAAQDTPPPQGGEDGELGPILVVSPPPTPQGGEDGELGPILVVASSPPPQGGEDGELGPILIASPPPAPQGGEDGELGPILIVAPPAGDTSSRPLAVRSRRPGLLFLPAAHRGELFHSGEELRVYGRAAGPLALRFYDLCLPAPADDHDAFLACASPVSPGERLGGEVVNGWTDDLDTFTFLLSQQRMVWIFPSAPLLTISALRRIPSPACRWQPSWNTRVCFLHWSSIDLASAKHQVMGFSP